VRAATEAMSCLEAKSVISPAIIPRPLNQHKLARLPNWLTPHSPRTSAAAAAQAAYWKSPSHKQCWFRGHATPATNALHNDGGLISTLGFSNSQRTRAAVRVPAAYLKLAF
jgi:hypothetical protein